MGFLHRRPKKGTRDGIRSLILFELVPGLLWMRRPCPEWPLAIDSAAREIFRRTLKFTPRLFISVKKLGHGVHALFINALALSAIFRGVRVLDFIFIIYCFDAWLPIVVSVSVYRYCYNVL